jgi:hypothetical protein
MGGRKNIRERYNIQGGQGVDWYALDQSHYAPFVLTLYFAQPYSHLLHSLCTHPGIARNYSRGTECHCEQGGLILKTLTRQPDAGILIFDPVVRLS